MMMRAHALGLLSDEEKLALFKRRSARWGAKAEPGDDKWEAEVPRLLRRTVELLIGEGILTAERIPRHLGFSPRDIEKLCNLRDNYFDTPAEVLDLATLRKAMPERLMSESDTRSGSVLSFSKYRK